MECVHPAAAGAGSAAGRPEAQAPYVRLQAGWARTTDEVRAAQRLRWRVFVDELGARLTPPAGTPPGHDADRFDDHCEHLLVWASRNDGSAAEAVGTYRVLTSAASRRAGGWYGESEFDLGPLLHLEAGMAELGRACVAAPWRSGGVILGLWGALAAFMERQRIAVVFGCASVPMRDGGHYAASLWRQLARRHLAEPSLRVRPRLPLPVDELRGDLYVEPPPLVKGYLRCGAEVLGPPAWDPDFNCADLPLMLRIDRLPEGYRRRLQGG